MLVDDEKDILRVIKRGLELDQGYLNNSDDIKFIVDTFSAVGLQMYLKRSYQK